MKFTYAQPTGYILRWWGEGDIHKWLPRFSWILRHPLHPLRGCRLWMTPNHKQCQNWGQNASSIIATDNVQIFQSKTRLLSHQTLTFAPANNKLRTISGCLVKTAKCNGECASSLRTSRNAGTGANRIIAQTAWTYLPKIARCSCL